MNWLWVHTEAISGHLVDRDLAGGLLPTTVISAMAGLSPLALLTEAIAAFGNEIQDDIVAGGSLRARS